MLDGSHSKAHLPGMELKDFVAVYAAIVSTAALGWQIWQAWRMRRPKLEVKLLNAVLGFDEPIWSVQIEARNRSSFPVRVTSAGFNLQDGSGRQTVIMQQPPGATLPGSISHADSAFTYLVEQELGPLDLHRPLVGWVSLSTGERFYSRPAHLRKPD